jgi:outer membrane receptor for ferrienterochelin and colicins
VGAVLNIITKEPVGKIEAGINQSIESNNTWRTRVEVGSAHEQFSMRTSGFRNSSDGFGANGSGAYAARYEDYGATLKLTCKPSAKSDINLTSRYFSHETFNPENTMNVKHQRTQTLTAGANSGFWSSDKKNNLRLSVNYDKYFDYDVLERKNDENKLKNTASYLSARAVDTYTPTDNWELVGGAEYNHEENHATTTLGSTPTTKTLDDISGFAQAQYKLLPDLDLIGGARYTYNTQFGSALAPKISLMYALAGFKFRGGVGSAFRAPSIKELYYDFDHQGMFWVYGNPDLTAERGLHTSLSVEYTKEYFNISVSGYHNKIGNKITQYDVITEQGANQKYYKNVSSATLAGIDVTASYVLFSEIVLKGSYSYCDAVDNSTGLQLSSNVRHSAAVSATWNGRAWQSPFSLQFAGRMNSSILYQELAANADGIEQAELTQSKSYSIWKAVLVKPFNIKKHTIEIMLKIDNIFNFKEASFINPGRQYMAGLRYSFK